MSTYLGPIPEDEVPEATVSNTYIIPRKEISTVPDMGKWKRSQVGCCFLHLLLLYDFPCTVQKVPYHAKKKGDFSAWLLVSVIQLHSKEQL